jgi:hypothetical protein
MNASKLTLAALITATLGIAATSGLAVGPGTGWRAGDCPRAELQSQRSGMMGYHHRVGHRMNGSGYHRGGPGWVDPTEVDLSKVKSDLGITADQEAAWDAYAQALEQRAETVSEHRQAMLGLTPAERAQAREAFRSGRIDTHTQVIEARDQLFETLTPEQRTKAAELPGLRCAPLSVGQQS